MAKFEVYGPFEIPTEIGAACKIVDVDKARENWNSSWANYAKKRGCYVFAMRASRGGNPVYIGQATKSFQQECFTDHKLLKLQRALAKQRKGTPVLFFICHPSQKGAVNKKEITAIEKFFIELGYNKNPDLENDRGVQKPTWSIVGIIRSDQGKPSKAASKFKKVFGLTNGKSQS